MSFGKSFVAYRPNPCILEYLIVIPSGSGILVLIAFSIISGYRYQLKRREAQQLRDQMLEQERQN